MGSDTHLMDTPLDGYIADRQRDLDRLLLYDLHCFRYVIQLEKIAGMGHGRCAVDTLTGREVFIKFFPGRPQEFKNAVRAHRDLREARLHVCR